MGQWLGATPPHRDQLQLLQALGQRRKRWPAKGATTIQSASRAAMESQDMGAAWFGTQVQQSARRKRLSRAARPRRASGGGGTQIYLPDSESETGCSDTSAGATGSSKRAGWRRGEGVSPVRSVEPPGDAIA